MRTNSFNFNSSLRVSLSYWLQHHLASAKKSLLRLLSSPVSFTITCLMIAIAFVVPAAIYVLFSGLDKLTTQWSDDKQITLFLNTETQLQQAESLRDKLLRREDIASAEVIHKKEALKEFKRYTNFGSVADSLPSNPLPHLIVANPPESLKQLSALQNLQKNLLQLNQVEHVQFDLIWVQRLQSTISILYRILWIITLLLLTGIFLIVANVIRWEVASRHEELEIIRLVGGSDAYVRRPFLYSGLWLGITGALAAIVIVKISGWIIGNAVSQLIALYGSDARLTALPWEMALLMLVFGGIFGTAGAWVAVRQRLKLCV